MPIFIHGSFLLLIAWILLQSSSSLHNISLNILFTAAVFFCVLLHELGHVMTAQLYGIKTRDITLYPFGGIATVLSDPTPKQELLIALAGPAVNIVIACIIYPFSGLSHPFHFQGSDSILSSLYVANVTLAAFNLVPALPMDGGRVLRSVLAILNVQQATAISARLSQIVSIGMGIFGIAYDQPMLTIIAILVFLGSLQEMLRVRTKHAVTGRIAKDLVCEFDKLYSFTHGTTLTSAMNSALRTAQEYFPVVYQGKLLGIIHRDDLVRATADTGSEQYVSGMMHREFVTVPLDAPLGEALEIANEQGVDILAVADQGEFIGFLYPKNITEYMLIDSLRQNPPPGEEEFPL